tara:strand:- start:718 stop:852 length:135 start_codon:yes stop_codon:yes gene_type:complete
MCFVLPAHNPDRQVSGVKLPQMLLYPKWNSQRRLKQANRGNAPE